jgi:hypothetical protein
MSHNFISPCFLLVDRKQGLGTYILSSCCYIVDISVYELYELYDDRMARSDRRGLRCDVAGYRCTVTVGMTGLLTVGRTAGIQEHELNR